MTSSTASAATKALRAIWPTPITLRSTINTAGDLEVTAGRGCAGQAEGAADVISRALGTTWHLVHVEKLRNNIRITYRLAPPKPTFDDVVVLTGQPGPAATTSAQSATTSGQLPAGWAKVAAGHYRHAETGTEIVNTWGGRKLSEWWVCVPPARGVFVGETAEGRCPVVHEIRTLTAAFVVAEERVIPRTREILATAWDEAHFQAVGAPDTWIGAPTDEATIAARRAAVAASGAPTGRTAEPGQIVVNFATGTPGTFDGRVYYAKPFHGWIGEVAAVTWAGSPIGPQPVAPCDVVVLNTDQLWCRPVDDDTHLDHYHAVSPECLIDDPDHDLEGAPLIPVGRSIFNSADGVSITCHPDGTYWAYGPEPRTGGETLRGICSSQLRLSATYRSINRYRAEVAEHREACRAIAATVDVLTLALRDADAKVAELDAAYQSAVVARRLITDYERAALQAAKITAARIRLALDLAVHPDRRQRFLVAFYSSDDGSTWVPYHFGVEESDGDETPAGQALRYATGHDLIKGGQRWQTPHPYLVQVWTDPIAERPDGVWTNLTDPCPAGRHVNAEGKAFFGPERADGSSVQHTCCMGCFHRVWRVYAADGAVTPWVIEGEPLPAPDPAAVSLPVETIRTIHYGMEIHDGFGTWRRLIGVGAVDPRTYEVQVISEGRTGWLPASTLVQLRTARDLDDTQNQNPAVQNLAVQNLGDDTAKIDAGGLAGPVSLGYRLQAQTQNQTRNAGWVWATVRAGQTPLIYRPAQNHADGLADTVLGNARQLLGLGPRHPLPNIRVQTWNRQTGITSYATNGRDRY
jgi:hypothetical protein